MAIPSEDDPTSSAPPEDGEEQSVEHIHGDDPEEDDAEEYEEDDEEDEEEGEEEGEEEALEPNASKKRLNYVFRRLLREPVWIRVQDVVIKGNSKTKASLIEAEVRSAFHRASSVHEIVLAASLANSRLRQLKVFDSVTFTLDAGPPELPGTTNVVIEVVEASNPLSGNIGVYCKPKARAWALDGSLKLKNLFGYADIWDVSAAYGWDKTTDLSAGVFLPRFQAIPTPLKARVSLLFQDLLKLSSYKEKLMGLSFGLVSTTRHDLACHVTFHTLTDPSCMSAEFIRNQLRNSLLSSLKYTYKFDKRDSHLRPTSGYAFLSSSQLGGLVPNGQSLRFFQQVFDLRGALPLCFYNAALNYGVAAGTIIPWARGSNDSISLQTERFYFGENSSSVCNLGWPASLLGFKTRGLGVTDLHSFIASNSASTESPASPRSNALGGDMAVTAFADLSFDLPLKLFRESGIYGHAFIASGNLTKLTGSIFKNPFREFQQTFRSSAGFGLILPTKLFRLEINYSYILRQSAHDNGKTGLQFNFSSP